MHTVLPPHGQPGHVTLHACVRTHSIGALPEEVDVWVVAVLGPSGVAAGERAEEGVGEQTGHLLLRHGDGVAGASLEEGYRLGEEQGRS